MSCESYTRAVAILAEDWGKAAFILIDVDYDTAAARLWLDNLLAQKPGAEYANAGELAIALLLFRAAQLARNVPIEKSFKLVATNPSAAAYWGAELAS